MNNSIQEVRLVIIIFVKVLKSCSLNFGWRNFGLYCSPICGSYRYHFLLNVSHDINNIDHSDYTEDRDLSLLLTDSMEIQQTAELESEKDDEEESMQMELDPAD